MLALLYRAILFLISICILICYVCDVLALEIYLTLELHGI